MESGTPKQRAWRAPCTKCPCHLYSPDHKCGNCLRRTFANIWKCGACGDMWCESCYHTWTKDKNESGMQLRSGRQLVSQ